MLSRFDDYPIHQTPEPIAHPATPNRNTYDRYWFNGYAEDGEFYFGIGAAVYPNLGIMDCGFSIVRDGEQHAFHGSRRIPLEPSQIEVGPFRIDILEPMSGQALPTQHRATVEALRADAWFQKGDPARAVNLYLQRENWLDGESAVETNRRRLWLGLLVSDVQVLRTAAETAFDPVVQGWLTLGALAASTGQQGGRLE